MSPTKKTPLALPIHCSSYIDIPHTYHYYHYAVILKDSIMELHSKVQPTYLNSTFICLCIYMLRIFSDRFGAKIKLST